MEEQSQCLEESQNCFESKVGEGFRLIDLNFLIEELRRGRCTCKVSFLVPTTFSTKIGLLKVGVKINVKSIILQTIEALQQRPGKSLLSGEIK